MSKRFLLGVCFVTCLTMASKTACLQTEKVPPLKSETTLPSRISQAVGTDFVVRPSDSDELFMTTPAIEKIEKLVSPPDSKPLRVVRKRARKQVKQVKEISRDVSRAQELVTHDDVQGSINFLPYEKIRGRGVRFRYETIAQERIGHLWFVKARDLRGKTIRISYSGMVPREMTFKLSRSETSAVLVHRFRLKDSSETQALSFRVPVTLPFKDVSIFKFEVEKSSAGRTFGDFLIEKVEVLDSQAATKMETVPGAKKTFPFGDPFLQSNPWGGEVAV